MGFLDVMKVGLGEIGMPRGRKKKVETEEEKLEEKIKQKEKEFEEGKGEDVEEENKEKDEHTEQQLEQPKEVSLEEVIYSLSGQAALLSNLNRFELTSAEHNALDTGINLITNAISGYIEQLKETERGKVKEITP
jgi:formyltetrahydrofolate synthetase